MNIWVILFLVVQYLFIGVVIAAVFDGVSRDKDDDGHAVTITFACTTTFAWPVVLFVLLIWAASKPFVFVYRSLVAMICDESEKRKAHLCPLEKGGSCALYERECIGPSKCPAYSER